MKLLIKLFGILLLLAGILLIVKPELVFTWIDNNMENTSLYISAIVVRLVFGVLFVVAAKASKYPAVLKFFGYLFILAAFILIFIGQEHFQDFITSIIPDAKPFAPLTGLLIIAFGGFLIYAFLNKKLLKQ